MRKRVGVIAVQVLCATSLCWAQGLESNQKLAEQAHQEYVAGKFADAERDFRELTKRDASDIRATTYFGHSLFRQGKYADAVAPYEKARELEQRGKKTSNDEHRILIDQLVMAYGISGQLNQAQALLHESIKKDPEYPLNYYNLACANATQGDKSNMLANLWSAFEHKDNVLKGEKMPDPRTDSSFENYVHDSDFVALMKKLGYE